MSDGVDIQLADLLGMHALHGIARDVVAVGRYNETVQRVVLLIDDFVVEFLEDAEDGYRSSLGKATRYQSVSRYNAECDGVSFAPIHPALIVTFRHRADGRFGKADAIYAIDERTGLVVLDVGTDDIDDYYPSFVFEWNPAGWELPKEWSER